jgi:hypothetical protein
VPCIDKGLPLYFYVMTQTNPYPQNLTKVVAAAGRASQLVRGFPFDVAREAYAKAVRAGFVKDSMLAGARFARDLGMLEKLTLGPWARGV